MIYHNEPLTSKDAQRYADDIVESISLLEDKIKELEIKLEDEKTLSQENQQIAEQKGFDEGYAKAEQDLEKKYKPKFVFR